MTRKIFILYDFILFSPLGIPILSQGFDQVFLLESNFFM